MFDIPSTEVSRRLLAWYGREGRDLPWRNTRDPYRIWLSEIMLQQTGVKTVVPYYRRFLEAFPEVGALAAAPVERVVELWAGLGYYSRARNLHSAARIVAESGGRFPDSLEGLTALPGIGRSTAGAILSIAFDRPAPILDGNVRRVLSRLTALQEDPRSACGERLLWRQAELFTPEDQAHDYAQAIMDLGAIVCTPRQPFCGECPLVEICQARRQGLENELPRRRPRKPVPMRTGVALLLECDGKFLVRRRPMESMLGGLWEFPSGQVGLDCSPAETARRLLADLGLAVAIFEAGRVAHAYSHFRLDLRLYRAVITGASSIREGTACWRSGESLSQLHLHGAHRKALAFLARND